MGGADCQHLRKAELEKIRDQRLMHFLIDLVDDQDKGAPSGSKHPGQLAIQRCEAGAAVDNKEEQIGTRDRDLRGHMGRLGKIRIRCIADTTRIDDLEGRGARLADSGETIAGHSRLIMDNRNPPSHETVEEGGFPHIGATDNSDSSHEKNKVLALLRKSVYPRVSRELCVRHPGVA